MARKYKFRKGQVVKYYGAGLFYKIIRAYNLKFPFREVSNIVNNLIKGGYLQKYKTKFGTTRYKVLKDFELPLPILLPLPIVIVKPYIAREKTPDFFQHFGISADELQGDDIQLSEGEVRNWDSVKESIKQQFIDKLLNKLEEDYAKKTKKKREEVRLKGRRKIQTKLSEFAEFYGEENV